MAYVNQGAIKFVKQLAAAFCPKGMFADIRELYTEKISKWRLTAEQWEMALDSLIENHKDEVLPLLNEIYPVLKGASKSSEAANDTNMGWLHFDYDGRSYGIRVYCRDGIWLIARLTTTDSHRQTQDHQPHYGEPAAKYIPQEATNIICTPDHPARIPANEMPTKEEKAAYRKIIMENIQGLIYG